MPKYYGCPCEGCGKPLTLQDDIVVCPDCGAPYHRDLLRESWAAASTPRPTPPDTSGSSLTRKVSCAPALPAASAPCAARKLPLLRCGCPRRGQEPPRPREADAREFDYSSFTASSGALCR